MKSLTPMKPLLFALIASASSAQCATVIYTENFANVTGSTINYNAVGWQAYRGLTATNIGNVAPGATLNQMGILSNVPTGGFAFKEGNNGHGLAYTTEFAPVDRSVTEIDTISFYSNNTNTTDVVRITVQIAGAWYATEQTFFRNSSTAGAATNWATNGELESFSWSTAASSWRALTFTAGTTLSLSATTLGSALPMGNLTAAGLLMHGPTINSQNAAHIRVDNFQIATVPEPSALALTGLGLAALAFRRKR